MAALRFKEEQFVVIARVAAPGVMDIRILNRDAARTAGHIDKGDAVRGREPAFETVDGDVRHLGTTASDTPLPAAAHRCAGYRTSAIDDRQIARSVITEGYG